MIVSGTRCCVENKKKNDKKLKRPITISFPFFNWSESFRKLFLAKVKQLAISVLLSFLIGQILLASLLGRRNEFCLPVFSWTKEQMDEGSMSEGSKTN